MQDKLLSIGHISDFCSVPVKTLRYYDDIDLVNPVYVNPITRYRYYSPEQAEIIFLIKTLRELGFAISQIKSVLRNRGLGGLVNLFRSREETLQSELILLKEKLDEVAQLREQYENIEMEKQSGQSSAIVLKRFLDRPIVFLKHQTSYDGMSFKEAFEQLAELARKNNLRVRKTMMAVFHGDYRNFDPLKVDIEFCFEVLSEITVREKFTRSIPPGLFASLLFTGGYEQFRKEGYSRLYSWLKSNGYTPQGPSIEIYRITRPVSRIVGDFVTELQVPVRKKGGTQK